MHRRRSVLIVTSSTSHRGHREHGEFNLGGLCVLCGYFWLSLRDIFFVAMVLAILLMSTGPAWGHRLEGDALAKKVQKVKIESWFDLGGVPSGARLQVYRKSDGQLLLERTLDENGRLTFFADWEPLHVVISAGDGHQKEIDIQPEADVTRPLPPADRSSRIEIKDILVGVGFLLALAAFILSLRNYRRFAALKM